MNVLFGAWYVFKMLCATLSAVSTTLVEDRTRPANQGVQLDELGDFGFVMLQSICVQLG